MTTIQRSRAIMILVLVLVSIGICAPTFLRNKLPEWWPSHPIRLGLDLKGGSYLTLQVETEEAVKGHLGAVASSVKSGLRKEQVGVLRSRVTSPDTLEVTLMNESGVPKLEDYMLTKHRELVKLKQETVESRPTHTFQLKAEEREKIKDESVIQAISTVRNRVDQFGVSEPTIQRSGFDKLIVQLPDLTDLSRVENTIGRVAKLEFKVVAAPGASGSDTQLITNRDGTQIRVEDEVKLSGAGVEQARVEIDSNSSEVQVSLKFNEIGARTFDEVTSENVGRQLAIVLDGKVQSAPVIRERISGGTAVISGQFTTEEAGNLAIVLRSGALPAPLKVLEKRTVGASLGADSIRQGVYATLVGTGLVVLFMIIYYAKSGVVAVASVVLNILFLLAMLALLGATLTLPGIAGLALTVGMAVDSNVIIYERIREEIRAGVSPRAAIDAGFYKAHWTILDANLTTLLSGIILYALGTGPIKGFAVTLSFGVITTIFAALVLSKLAFEVLSLKRKDGTLSI